MYFTISIEIVNIQKTNNVHVIIYLFTQDWFSIMWSDKCCWVNLGGSVRAETRECTVYLLLNPLITWMLDKCWSHLFVRKCFHLLHSRGQHHVNWLGCPTFLKVWMAQMVGNKECVSFLPFIAWNKKNGHVIWDFSFFLSYGLVVMISWNLYKPSALQLIYIMFCPSIGLE